MEAAAIPLPVLSAMQGCSTTAGGRRVVYAIPGAEALYEKLGFLRMNTAMAIWHDTERVIKGGLLREP